MKNKKLILLIIIVVLIGCVIYYKKVHENDWKKLLDNQVNTNESITKHKDVVEKLKGMVNTEVTLEGYAWNGIDQKILMIPAGYDDIAILLQDPVFFDEKYLKKTIVVSGKLVSLTPEFPENGYKIINYSWHIK